MKYGELLKIIRKKGKESEKQAFKWLIRRKFKIIYWHKGKANNKPYDIICVKANKHYALDVKSGKTAKISLVSLIELLTKGINDFRLETDCSDLKRIDKVGYLFVIDKKCLLFDFPKKRYDAYLAWDKIEKK